MKRGCKKAFEDKKSLKMKKNPPNACRFKKKPYLCIAFETKHFSERSFGEMAEWSIAAVLKTVVLRGTGGSNPSLSAIKGFNGLIINKLKPLLFWCKPINQPIFNIT